MAKDKLKSRFFAASSSADQSNQRVKRKKSEGGQLIGSRGDGDSSNPLLKLLAFCVYLLLEFFEQLY